ncbi:MAG: OadG family protein [Prevotellaceae bacterium]|nr:OadG family protein [Candidatus Minthosoma caballi]
MQLLTITSDTWILAGISVAVVFGILVILVLILNIFTAVAKKTTAKATAVIETRKEIKQAKTFEKASEEDKAAVAMALYLYFEEINNREARVLTITPGQPSAWHAQLNPRL